MDEKQEFSRITSIKKCPICEGKIDEGYIVGGVSWDTKKHKYDIGNAKRLVPYLSWTVPNLPALKCKQCKIVIFDYGKYAKE